MIDNPYNGIGYIGGYDYLLKRAWISKQGDFTLSYSTLTSNFFSFHDYYPDMVIPYNNRVFFLKEGLMYEMNKGPKNTFFGEKYNSSAVIVGGAGTQENKVFDNIFVDSYCYDENNILKVESFDKLRVHTPTQNTGDVTLIDGNDYDAVPSVGESLIKHRNDEYRLAIPRDAVKDNAADINDPLNIDQSDAEDRIKGDYSIIELTYSGVRSFSVKLIQILFRRNAR